MTRQLASIVVYLAVYVLTSTCQFVSIAAVEAKHVERRRARNDKVLPPRSANAKRILEQRRRVQIRDQLLNIQQQVRGLKQEAGGKCFHKDTSLVFDDIPGNDTFEGTFSKFGERNFWYGDDLVDATSGETVGTANGMCTVIGEVDASGYTTYMCTLTYQWTDGDLAGSSLTSEGLYRSATVDGIMTGTGEYTFLGGTGCFANNVSGRITQTVVPGGSGFVFRNTILPDE